MAKLTKEELIADLQAKCQKLRRQPRPSEIGNGFTKYSISAYRNHFGNLANAIREAGCDHLPKAPKHNWKMSPTKGLYTPLKGF